MLRGGLTHYINLHWTKRYGIIFQFVSLTLLSFFKAKLRNSKTMKSLPTLMAFISGLQVNHLKIHSVCLSINDANLGERIEPDVCMKMHHINLILAASRTNKVLIIAAS